MKYTYKCKNKDCENFDKEVIIEKSMSESGREEFCEKCNSKMIKVYNSAAIRTGDNFKS